MCLTHVNSTITSTKLFTFLPLAADAVDAVATSTSLVNDIVSIFMSVDFRWQEEKRYYQMELVNRETNFNKLFNADPKVGVLNPLTVHKVDL